MGNKKQGILLFALCIALLIVISARVSPGEARDTSQDGPRETRYIMPSELLLPEETATPSPTPSPEETDDGLFHIRDLFPNASPGDWNLRLVNNSYTLTASFEPKVTETRDGELFDSRAVEALESMLSAAEAAGHSVSIRAAYLPYQTQAYLFFGRATKISEDESIAYEDAEKLAREVVAYPGTSDHQTGLAVDLMDSHTTAMDAAAAERLPLIAWLRQHCAEYGFIPRYPQDKQEITGWYEPWHFRYVGTDAAAYMTENNLCLEEFIALF